MKKTSTLPFLFLVSAAFMLPTILGDVLDTDGNQVVAGTEYYILPAITGNGGGLTRDNAKSCPPDVVQALDEADNGLPVAFSPLDPTLGNIVSSSDSIIRFSATNICALSNIWMVNFNSSTGVTGQLPVTIGGVRGNPGSWFQIQQFDEAYKLVFCPVVCAITCEPRCRDLGIVGSTEDGTRRLVFTSDPFKVVFKKV